MLDQLLHSQGFNKPGQPIGLHYAVSGERDIMQREVTRVQESGPIVKNVVIVFWKLCQVIILWDLIVQSLHLCVTSDPPKNHPSSKHNSQCPFSCFWHLLSIFVWFFSFSVDTETSVTEKQKRKETPALTQLVVREREKIARDRERFVILEDVMFSWLLFGFTSLDQSIHFVLLCVKNKMTVLTKICLSAQAQIGTERLRRILNRFSLFGNHLSIRSVALWLCILSCDYGTVGTALQWSNCS